MSSSPFKRKAGELNVKPVEAGAKRAKKEDGKIAYSLEPSRDRAEDAPDPIPIESCDGVDNIFLHMMSRHAVQTEKEQRTKERPKQLLLFGEVGVLDRTLWNSNKDKSELQIQIGKVVYIVRHEMTPATFTDLIAPSSHFSDNDTKVAPKRRLDSNFNAWKRKTGQVIKHAVFSARDIYGADNFRMATSKERRKVWKYFILQAPVAVFRAVLGHPASVLHLDQIWYGDEGCEIRKAWRAALVSVVVFACEDMWGLINAVEKEDDVTQDQVNEWYRRWKRMPKAKAFGDCKHWDFEYVPMQNFTEKGTRGEMDESEDGA